MNGNPEAAGPEAVLDRPDRRARPDAQEKGGLHRRLGHGLKFKRTRRITGYLVGTLDRFNNAKRAEERDRVKHGMYISSSFPYLSICLNL